MSADRFGVTLKYSFTKKYQGYGGQVFYESDIRPNETIEQAYERVSKMAQAMKRQEENRIKEEISKL